MACDVDIFDFEFSFDIDILELFVSAIFSATFSPNWANLFTNHLVTLEQCNSSVEITRL